MSVEQFKNRSVTTLNGTITSGATSLVVTDSTQLPASGPFRIGIDNEIIMVSSISGSTCTIVRGQEGTTAAGHTNGATITHFLTAGGLQAYVKGITSYSINVQDFGAKGDGVTDDSAAILAAINAVPQTSPNRGGTVYFPRGRYYLATGINLSTAVVGLRLLGEAGSPSSLQFGPSSATQILVGSQQIGLRYNSANAADQFSSIQIEQMMFSPLHATSSGSYSGGATLTTTGTADLTPFATSGVVWIQDGGGKVGKVTYTGKTSTQFTGCTISNETILGATYATGSLVAVDALGGVKTWRTSNMRMKAVTFNSFFNVSDGAFGLYNDGTSGICQYNSMFDVWFNACWIGAKEDTCSSRWVLCDWDNQMSLPPITGSTGYLGLNAKTLQFTNCNFSDYDTLVSIDGGGAAGQQINGCRFEAWVSRALLISNTTNFTFNGSSMSNSINGSVGNAIEIGAGVDSAVIRLGRIAGIANKVFCTSSASTALVEFSGNGSPEGVEYATAGSRYFQSNATSQTNTWIKTTNGTLNTGWKIMSPNDAPRLRRTYASFNTLASDRWTAPNAAPLQITGLIDLQAQVLLTNYATGVGQNLLTKWTTSGNQRSYQLTISTTGILQFLFSFDGVGTQTVSSGIALSAILPYLDTPVWLRALADPTAGSGGNARVKFYYSTNGTSWFNFATIDGSNAGPWFSGTGTLAVSGQSSGTNPVGGRIYRARIYSGDSTSGGTLVASFDATNMEVGNLQPYTDAQGNVWTPQSTAAILADAGNELEIRSSNTSLKDALYLAEGAFNVKHFGAIGDGIADDSTAIGSALSAASSHGGVVFFPPGTYIAQNLTTYSNVKVVGGGQSSTVIKLKAGSTNHLFTASNSGWFGISTLSTDGDNNFGFFDITLDGNKTNAPAGGNGLNIFGYFYRLERVTIRNFHGIGWYSEWGSSAGGPGTGEVRHFAAFRIDIHNCDGGGMKNMGSGDSAIYMSEIHQNLGIGIDNQPWTNYNGGSNLTSAGGAGLHLVSVHVWGNATVGPTHTTGINLAASAFLVDVYCEQSQNQEIIAADTNISIVGGKLFNNTANPTSGGGVGIVMQTGPNGTPSLMMSNTFMTNLPGGAFKILNSAGRNVISNVVVFNGTTTTVSGNQTGTSGSWTFNVASTTGFPPTGTLFIGKVMLTYSAIVSGTSFTVTGGNGAVFSGGTTVSQGAVLASGSNSFTANDTVDILRSGDGLGADSIRKISSLFNKAIDVTDYGAKGDGVTDDTAAIQAAITAVPTSGGTVNFPRGTYLISTAIDLNNRANIKLIGENAAASILKLKANTFGTTATNTLMRIRVNSTRIVVENLGFDGNKANMPYTQVSGLQVVSTTVPSNLFVNSTTNFPASGTIQIPDASQGGANPSSSYTWVTVTYTSIDATHFNGCTVTAGAVGSSSTFNNAASVTLTAGGDAITVDGSGGAVTWNTIRNCRFTNQYGRCIYHATVTDSKIIGCTFENAGVTSSAESAGDSLGLGRAINLQNGTTRLLIENNHIESCVNGGIACGTVGTTSFITINANSVENCGWIGIGGGASNTNIVVSNNLVKNNINNNIDMGGCSDFIVMGNTSVGGRTAIDIDGSAIGGPTDGLIANNTIIGTTTRHGIGVTCGHNMTITGNVIRNSFQNGIAIGQSTSATTNVIVANNMVSNSGQDGSGTRVGIRLGSETNGAVGPIDVVVTGNRCYDDQGSKTQQYGLRSYGISDFVTITGNNFRGNAAGGLSLVGLNNVATGNLLS